MLKLKLQYFGHLMQRYNRGKDSEAGKDWGQEKKRTIEDEMVGWHHWLNGHKFEQTPEDNEGQGSLVGCSPWGYKESDTTEWLNWHELKHPRKLNLLKPVNLLKSWPQRLLSYLIMHLFLLRFLKLIFGSFFRHLKPDFSHLMYIFWVTSMLQTGSETGYCSKTVSFRKDTDTLSNYKKQWGKG